MPQAPVYVDGQIQNLPYGLLNTNPPASPFLSESIYSPEFAEWMERMVMTKLFYTTPKKMLPPSVGMMLAQSLTKKETTKSNVFSYFETPFPRFPLIAAAGSAAVAASPGNTVTQTYTVTADSAVYFAKTKRVFFEDGTNAIVESVSGTTVVLRSLANSGLPAVVAGNGWADGDAQGYDGGTSWQYHNRIPILRRFNYVQKIGPRTVKYDRMEEVELRNNNLINYIQENAEAQARQIVYSVDQHAWLSQRSEGQLVTGEKFKTTGGIHDAMVASGAPIIPTTLSALPATFEAVAQATDFQGPGTLRTLCAVPRLLTELSKAYKWEFTRYQPTDMVANLDLKNITFSGMDFGYMPMHHWLNRGLMPQAYQNRIYCVNWDNVSMVSMDGLPMFEYGLRSLSRTDRPGSTDDFVVTGSQAHFALKINNPQEFFCLEVTGP